MQASVTRPAHHARKERGTRRRQATQQASSSGIGRDPITSTALTPPMQTTAAALSTAARTCPIRPRAASRIGSTTHGRTAPGRLSALITPTVPSIRGLIAKTRPASVAGCEDRPSTRAQRRAPSKATMSTSAVQRRCPTQGGRPDHSTRTKKAPCGKR